MKILTISLFILFNASFNGFAQSASKDTIYFYIDNDKIPINDQIITVDKDANYTDYAINCACLLDNSNAMFINVEKTGFSTISESEFKGLTFISIINLIKIVKRGYLSGDLNTQHIFYFIERSGNRIFKRNVVFIPPREITDKIIIKN